MPGTNDLMPNNGVWFQFQADLLSFMLGKSNAGPTKYWSNRFWHYELLHHNAKLLQKMQCLYLDNLDDFDEEGRKDKKKRHSAIEKEKRKGKRVQPLHQYDFEFLFQNTTRHSRLGLEDKAYYNKKRKHRPDLIIRYGES